MKLICRLKLKQIRMVYEYTHIRNGEKIVKHYLREVVFTRCQNIPKRKMAKHQYEGDITIDMIKYGETAQLDYI